MKTLEEGYADDPILLMFYANNLPKVGWPGATDDCEREYRRRYRANQNRKPRGKPFQPQTPSPSQRPAALVRDEEESTDLSAPRMEQAAS